MITIAASCSEAVFVSRLGLDPTFRLSPEIQWLHIDRDFGGPEWGVHRLANEHGFVLTRERARELYAASIAEAGPSMIAADSVLEAAFTKRLPDLGREAADAMRAENILVEAEDGTVTEAVEIEGTSWDAARPVLFTSAPFAAVKAQLADLLLLYASHERINTALSEAVMIELGPQAHWFANHFAELRCAFSDETICRLLEYMVEEGILSARFEEVPTKPDDNLHEWMAVHLGAAKAWVPRPECFQLVFGDRPQHSEFAVAEEGRVKRTPLSAASAWQVPALKTHATDVQRRWRASKLTAGMVPRP